MLRVLVLAAALLGGCALLQRDFTGLVKQEGAAVVAISAGYGARIVVEEPPVDEEPLEEEPGEFLGRNFGEGPQGPPLGSGFLISEDGYIVTNAHLVEHAVPGGIVVRLSDQREFTAALVGADPVSDIALLKIAGKGLLLVQRDGARSFVALRLAE